MKLAITGSDGYIGKKLLDRLTQTQSVNEILCLPRESKGRANNLSFDMQAGAIELPELDGLIHLAAFIPTQQSNADMLSCELTNGKGALHILESINKDAIRSIVNVSSHHIWDPKREGIISNPYEGSKRSSEVLFNAYRDRFKFNLVHLRIPYIYGPGMKHGAMFRIFIEKAMSHQPINLFNQGADQHHLCFCDDVVDGIVQSLHMNGSKTIEFVPTTTVSTLEIAQMVVTLTNSQSELKLMGERQFNQYQSNYNDSNEIRPSTSLEDGLKTLLTEDYGLAI